MLQDGIPNEDNDWGQTGSLSNGSAVMDPAQAIHSSTAVKVSGKTSEFWQDSISCNCHLPESPTLTATVARSGLSNR
jgi:hypothetical protein